MLARKHWGLFLAKGVVKVSHENFGIILTPGRFVLIWLFWVVSSQNWVFQLCFLLGEVGEGC